MLERVPDVLAWNEASQLHADLRMGHEKLLASKYEEKLERFRRAGIGRRLTELSESLPTEAVSRIQTAPESVCKLLYEPLHFGHLLSSLTAEHRRLGNEVDTKESVWTALGDWYFPAAGDNSQPVHAPQLSNGIPVDGASPQVSESVGLSRSTYRQLSPDEIGRGVDRLEAALLAISEASPATRELIDTYVRVVVIRGDEGEGPFASASYDNYIGKMAFLNAHADQTLQWRVMDGMVHEAIHSFLYIGEQRGGFFRDKTAANAIVAVSPWSGRQLPVHSFFHACYVWFGLWQFWRCAARNRPLDENATQFRDRARAGFFHPELPERMAALLPHLSDNARMLNVFIEDIRSGKYAGDD